MAGYYDNSTDEKLKMYQELYPDRFYCYVNTDPVSEFRTYNISKGRNICLSLMKEKYSDYEYFIMMDCDNVCSDNLNQSVLLHYLSRNDWDSLSFNHPNGYYDPWALSKYPLFLGYNHFNNGYNIYANYISNIIKKTPKDKLIPCFSAFNGFAIYRTNKFLNCYYSGEFTLNYVPKKIIEKNIRATGRLRSRNVREDCEHRSFHFQAVRDNNARIRISPFYLFEKRPVSIKV